MQSTKVAHDKLITENRNLEIEKTCMYHYDLIKLKVNLGKLLRVFYYYIDYLENFHQVLVCQKNPFCETGIG